MRKLTRKCLAAGLVVTAATVASAQGPGRAAAPDDRPPAGWLAGPTSTAVRPLTGAEQAAASVAPPKKPSLVESTFSGVKSFIAPPPGTPATPTPLPQGMRPPAAPSAASPSVYAGPPAYRWYGYGAVTPGRNQHAPDGVSPRGSPNWYAQSGATPGAFPVTVTASGQPATVAQAAPPEPPSYTVGNVAGSFDRTPTQAPQAVPDPSQPLPATSTASVEPASLSTPAPAEMTPLPVTTYPPPTPMPASEPTPSLMPTVTPRSPTPSVTPPARLSEPPAFAPTAAAPPTEAATPAGPQPLLTWNSTSTDPAVAFSGVKSAPADSVAAVSPTPAVSVAPVTVAVTPVSPGVVPASFTPAPAAPAVATPTWGAAKPVGRSQGPGDAGAPTLDQAIRNAAYGFAAVLEVKHTGPSAVAVRLQAATAADARSAAEFVSKLPALKPYAVEFLVTLTK